MQDPRCKRIFGDLVSTFGVPESPFFQGGGRGEGLTAPKKRCWLFGRQKNIEKSVKNWKNTTF